MTSKILLRRGTAAQWVSANPVLSTGELGIETDTLKIKVGNGTSTWTQLTSYANITQSELTAAINGLINAAPSALDTLNELAAAINNDSSFSTTVNNLLNGKVSKSGGDTITSSTTSTIGLIVKAMTSQTANILEIQNSTGGVIFAVSPLAEVISYRRFTAISPAAATVAMIARAAASQTADIQQWQDSTGAAKALVGSNGNGVFNGLRSGSGSTIGAINAYTSSAQIGMLIRGAASQTANLQEWQDSAGTVITSISSGGGIDTTVQLTGRSAVTAGTGNYLSASLNVVPLNASIVGAVIRGVASQTANLQEWQNSSGTVLASVASDGKLNLNTSGTGYINLGDGQVSKGPGNGFSFNSDIIISNGKGVYSSLAYINNVTSTSTVPLTVKGIASQSTNLQEWQNSSGTVLASVDKDGYLQTPRLTITNGGNIIDSAGTTPYFGFGSNQIAIYARNAAYKPLIIQGATSQTANLQEWQNSSGTVIMNVTSGGDLGVSAIRATGGSVQRAYFDKTTESLRVVAATSSYIGLVVRGVASQSANLQEWQDNSATAWASVNVQGVFNSNNSTGYQIGGATYYGTLNSGQTARIQAGSAVGSNPHVVVRQSVSQTGDLQQWQDSSGNVLTKVSSTGQIVSNIQSSSAISEPLIIQNSASGVGTGTKLTMNYGGQNYAAIESAYSTSPGAGGAYLAIKTNHQASVLTTKLLIDNNGTVTINGFVAGAQGLIVKGAASQTANLIEWQNSSGTTLGYVKDNGYSASIAGFNYIYTNTIQGWNGVGGGISFSNTAPVLVTPQSASTVAFAVKGAASQTANLQEWQDSAGIVKAAVTSSGGFELNGKDVELMNIMGAY